MDSISKLDAPTAVHQDWKSSDEKEYGKGSENIVPIEEEAVEGAHHINLSWRSWVRSFEQKG